MIPMSRTDGRDPGGWGDEARARRKGGGSAVAGGGLMLATLAAIGLAFLARGPMGGADGEPARVRFQRTPSPLGSVAFAPDGLRLALGRSDGGVVIQDLLGGRPVEIEGGPGLGMLARGLAYSPDGRTLASGGLGRAVKLWDMASGSLRASLEGHRAAVGSVAFAPDGATLASGSLDGDVRLWDLAGEREPAGLAGHAAAVRGLAFSPDGATLASGSLDGTVRLWDVATGRELARFGDRGRKAYGLAFTPDGKRLALALGALNGGIKGEVGLWEPAGGPRAYRTLGVGSFAAVAISPDGRTLAGGGADRVVRLWDLGTLEEVASLAGHDGFIASLAFSPGGDALVTVGQDTLVGLFDLAGTPAGTGRHHL